MIGLSVIIPCKDEEPILPITLARIREEAKFGHIIETILVDNGSSDRSIEIAEEFSGIRILACPGTIADARNFGAAHAKGEFLCFIDADVEIERGWSREVVAFIEKHGSDIHSIVFGNIYGIREDPTWIERVWARSLSGRRKITYINGGNIICSRALFQRLNGFDGNLITGEDVDFSRRAREHGYSVIRDEQLHTIHHGYPRTLHEFYQRERWHGYGMSKSISHPWGSRAFLLACFTISLPALALSSIYSSGAALTAGGFVCFFSVAFLWSAHRLGKLFSFEVLEFLCLLSVYAIARSRSLCGLLLADGVGPSGDRRVKWCDRRASKISPIFRR